MSHLLNRLAAHTARRNETRLPENLQLLVGADDEGGIVTSRRAGDLDLLVTRGLATCTNDRQPGDYRPNRLDWNYVLTAAGRKVARAAA